MYWIFREIETQDSRGGDLLILIQVPCCLSMMKTKLHTFLIGYLTSQEAIFLCML